MALILSQGSVPLHGGLRVEPFDAGPVVVVDALLGPHEGRDVQVIAYHFPLKGLDPSKQGAGSCNLPEGACSFHNSEPTSLYSVQAKGLLSREECGWSVGGVPLHLDQLRGHYAGLLLFPTPELRVGPPEVTADDLSSLSAYMGQLQGLLEQVRARRNGQG
jgi:hypothetical protein